MSNLILYMLVTKDKIRFIVDIVDHCNLNCKCCGHFSPLAQKSFLDKETFEKIFVGYTSCKWKYPLFGTYGRRGFVTSSIRRFYNNYRL